MDIPLTPGWWQLRIIAASLIVVWYTALPLHSATQGATEWVGTWAAAPPPPSAAAMAIPQIVDRIQRITLREIVHTTLGGQALRVVLSNEFGLGPLQVSAVTAALSSGQGAIVPASLRNVTFQGAPSVTIPPGAVMLGDPIPLATRGFSDLAISLLLPAQTLHGITCHLRAMQVSYAAAGDQTRAVRLKGDSQYQSWYFLKSVQVKTARSSQVVIAFGDSITEGAHSTVGVNMRWPVG